MNKFSEFLVEFNNSLKEIKILQEEFQKTPRPSDGIVFDEEKISFNEMAYSFQMISTFNDKTLKLKEQIYNLISEYELEVINQEKIYKEKLQHYNKLINDIVAKAISKVPEEIFNYNNAIRVHKKLDLDEFILKNNLPHITNDWKTLVFVNESNVSEIKNLLFEEAISNMEGESKQVKSNTKGLLKIENFIEKDKPDLSKIQMILEALSKQ